MSAPIIHRSPFTYGDTSPQAFVPSAQGFIPAASIPAASMTANSTPARSSPNSQGITPSEGEPCF